MRPGLVSCAMVTGHQQERRVFTRMALEAFNRQTYPHRELVVLNQSGERWMPNRPDIREILTEPGVLGQKRNEILRYCHGELVVQWDDDDWHGFRRIAKHWETYKTTGKASLLTIHAMHEVDTGETKVVSGAKWKSRGMPGTLAHPRHLDPVYPKVSLHEDSAVAARLSEMGNLVPIANHPTDYVRFVHGGNSHPRVHYERLLAGGEDATVAVEAAVAGIQWLRKRKNSGGPCQILEDVSARLAGLKWMRLGRSTKIAEMYHAVHNPNILEVGHLYGVSTCYFALMAKRHGGVVVSIDLPHAAHLAPRAEETLAACGLSADIQRHPKGSRGVLPGLADNSFGLAYIDGSHEEGDTFFELQEASRLVVPGGMVVADDLDHPQYPGVRRAWDRWVSLRSHPSFEEGGVGYAVA